MRTLSALLLIICCYTDIKTRGIRVRILVIFFIVSLALMTGVCLFGDRMGDLRGFLIYEPGLRNMVCAIIPGILLLPVSIITREGIGKGDVYVIMLLGFMIGFDRIFRLLFVSMLSCGIFGLMLIIGKGKGRKDTLPYIPFLLGAYVVMAVINNMGGIGG